MMKGEEYQQAIAMLHMSQGKAADFLGVDPSTTRRWIANEHAIPVSVSRLLRLMVRRKILVSDVMKETERKIRSK